MTWRKVKDFLRGEEFRRAVKVAVEILVIVVSEANDKKPPKAR